jgi:hypothetical protein
MKTVFYNSKIAEFFTPLSGFKTIMLFGFVFTEKSTLSDSVIAHECVHRKQYTECAAAGLGLTVPCFIVFQLWWLWVVPFVIYYVLYIVEYLIRFIRFRSSNEAYYAVSFEREAYDFMYEYDKPDSARRKRRIFEWINYLALP